jgi:predicted O-linked N-acetylglucosamine transferase (SPINDLY family)
MVLTSPGLQRKSAEIYVSSRYPFNTSLPKIHKHSKASRIRIGYFSRDFREHPVSILAAELFERHDRSRFEVIAFSFSPNTMDWMRRRLESAFDRFIDVQNRLDTDIVALARELEIDLAVDLMGFHENSRPNIFAMRAAPIQINYLGYPGTMGAEYIDYIIADKTLIPAASQEHYSEKVIYLPDSCIPRDTKRVASDRVFERSDFGLPQQGIVFCGFNGTHKLNPHIFDQWARILHRVEGSVLWLSETNSTATANLRRQAKVRGIAPERLVFAPRMQSFADHLASFCRKTQHST